MTLTITRADGDELGTGEGYVLTWTEYLDGPAKRRSVYTTLDDALQSILYHFEGRYQTSKTERDYYGKVTIERGPMP